MGVPRLIGKVKRGPLNCYRHTHLEHVRGRSTSKRQILPLVVAIVVSFDFLSLSYSKHKSFIFFLVLYTHYNHVAGSDIHRAGAHSDPYSARGRRNNYGNSIRTAVRLAAEQHEPPVLGRHLYHMSGHHGHGRLGRLGVQVRQRRQRRYHEGASGEAEGGKQEAC